MGKAIATINIDFNETYDQVKKWAEYEDEVMLSTFDGAIIGHSIINGKRTPIRYDYGERNTDC